MTERASCDLFSQGAHDAIRALLVVDHDVRRVDRGIVAVTGQATGGRSCGGDDSGVLALRVLPPRLDGSSPDEGEERIAGHQCAVVEGVRQATASRSASTSQSGRTPPG
jgi:hypothetical protein